MPVIQLPTHKPRPYQRAFWSYMEGGGKRAYLVWCRRAGKDDSAASWTSVAALETKPAVYWHMFPEYAQARKGIWTAVNPHSGKRRIDEWFPPAIRKTTREQTMEIEFINGALWQVVGSDSFDSLVGASVKGVVFSEYALANPLAWAYLRPILLENDGWAIFPSTPRGRNHLFRQFEAARKDPEQFAQLLTAYDTGIISPETLEKERLEMIAEMGQDDGEAKFSQEWLCSWDAALVGSYYSREFQAIDQDKRITDVAYDPGLPVYTAWDLGVGDQTAIWFAQVDQGGMVKVIDYEVASGVSVDHYAKIVLGKPYIYKEHIVPHDAAARDWSAMGGKTRLDILRSLGISPLNHLPRDDVDDGIQAVRRLLARCVFDETKTASGVSALRAYRREWSDKYKRFEPKPLHDWASDPADAFRYLALGLPAKLALSPAATAQRRRDRAKDSASSPWAF